jgi:hypothetical protein
MTRAGARLTSIVFLAQTWFRLPAVPAAAVAVVQFPPRSDVKADHSAKETALRLPKHKGPRSGMLFSTYFQTFPSCLKCPSRGSTAISFAVLYFW